MALPLLTIAIPVFERKAYFEEALNSALNQTVPVNIIVVDNASSHRFFEEAVYKLGLEHVKYYRNSANLGMYGNWNKCVELATTEFVMILGDDDIIMPYYAERFYTVLQQHPEIDLFHGAMYRFGPNYNEPQQLIKFPLGRHTGEEMLLSCVKFGPAISTNAMAFRRSIHACTQFLYPEFAYNQDWLFVYTAFTNSICYGSNEVLLHLRINPGGNAVLVGERATLSLTMLYEAVANTLRVKHSHEAKIANRRAKFIIRNCLIKGKVAVLKEMVNDTANPFGILLLALIKKDKLVQIAIYTSPLLCNIVCYIFRIERSFYTKLGLL